MAVSQSGLSLEDEQLQVFYCCISMLLPPPWFRFTSICPRRWPWHSACWTHKRQQPLRHHLLHRLVIARAVSPPSKTSSFRFYPSLCYFHPCFSHLHVSAKMAMALSMQCVQISAPVPLPSSPEQPASAISNTGHRRCILSFALPMCAPSLRFLSRKPFFIHLLLQPRLQHQPLFLFQSIAS
jgi:hypothetical protein